MYGLIKQCTNGYSFSYLIVLNHQYNKFSISFFYDFLKKLVKEACLVDLLFVSEYDFLFVFFAGDGLFSFTGGSLVI